MSTAPTLSAIADVTLYSGTPLYIALDGYDVDGDALTFSVESTNDDLGWTLSEENRSMRITVEGYGDMVFELFENLAPGTTARIIELAESDFYDGLIFHRVAEYADGTPFVIQGGDPDGDGTGGSGVDFDDEFHPLAMHTGAGVLSMAKSGDDTNDSQFFITGAATRHLDFNHSVFGCQVEGNQVREAIQDVETDANDQPLTDVVMESVEVFLDEENGLLILSAPEGYTGQADVTVTVDDGNGGQASRTFHVAIEPDTIDDNPYLDPIANVALRAGGTTTLTLGSVDIEGSAVYYAGTVWPTSDDIQTSVSESTGTTTITAGGTAGGVYGIYVGVSNTANTAWDTQAVPVLVTPAAPNSIELLTSSDTGSDDSDNLTYLNNTSGQSLWFRVHGTVDGATVSLYADGQLIGQTTATSDSAVVVTNEAYELLDGTHSITAVQGFYDIAVEIGNSDDVVTLQSGESAALGITVDTTPPEITSAPITQANGGVEYVYDVESDVEAAGEATYWFEQSPSGMLINSQTGRITWTPKPSHGVDQQVIVTVEDAAGNQTQQPFEININRAPELWEIANQQIDEGSLLSFEVTANDPDSTPQDVTIISFGLDDGAPQGASITAIEPGKAQFNWTPTEADGPGQYDVWIRVTDEDGATSAEKITITVVEVNESPVLEEIGDAVVDEGELLQFDASATDADLPANVLTYTLAPGSPAGASIDPSTGRFTWRPGENHGGQDFQITVYATDPDGAGDQKTFQVNVVEVDDAPTFRSPDAQIAVAGTTFRTTARATDPDEPGNAIRYELEPGAPAGATIDAASGLIAWDVPIDCPSGSVFLGVRATEVLPDGTEGLSTVATLEVRIAVFPGTAFDQALALSDETPVAEVETAREAVDSLLFDFALEPVRTIRFLPAVPVARRGLLSTSLLAPPAESVLGVQIGTQGGGAGGVHFQPTQQPVDKGVQQTGYREEPADQADQPPPDDQASFDRAFSDQDDFVDDSGEPAELAPAKLLDAAFEELTEEAMPAETIQTAAAE